MSNNRIKLINENVKCSCLGYNLDKLLQPSILALLAKHEMHGYLIIQELEKKSQYNGEKIDNTGVYRTLKTLEDREMVSCEWALEETGPAKKIYKITDKGLECLNTWIKTLENYKKFVEQIIEDIKEISRGEAAL